MTENSATPPSVSIFTFAQRLPRTGLDGPDNALGRHMITPHATRRPLDGISSAPRPDRGTCMPGVDGPGSARSANESPPDRNMSPHTDEVIMWPDPSPLDAWWEHVVHA
ncbi:hypothetical protein, partial [Rhodococcus globerulus]|uniref:hypothetical protein n=1 Tax=Rhodococcus globerulus TaxID=33008 RepID=UPI0011125D54